MIDRRVRDEIKRDEERLKKQIEKRDRLEKKANLIKAIESTSKVMSAVNSSEVRSPGI